MLNQIPIEWIIGIIGVIAAAIGFKLKLNHAKKEGQNEIINSKTALDFNKIIEYTTKANEIRSQNTDAKLNVPNDWGIINKLRKKGRTSLQDIASPPVRKSGKEVKK